MAVSPLYILLERLNLFNIETLRLEYLSGKTAKNCLLKLIEKKLKLANLLINYLVLKVKLLLRILSEIKRNIELL